MPSISFTIIYISCNIHTLKKIKFSQANLIEEQVSIS